MTERSDQPQDPPAGSERPEVFSVSQDKDGSFHFSRRDFLYLSAAIGGTLLLRRACPRFGANSPGEPVQAGVGLLPRVYVHAEPSIASNIAATLQQDDFVRLISDRPDLGWVEVATRSGQHGWVQRSSVDFSRAIKSSSPNFDLSSTLNPNPTQTHPPRTLSIQLRRGDDNPVEVLAPGQSQACGEVIQNGDFEAGPVYWVEETTGFIISDEYFDPYQGSWVAWFGGPDANERLTQLFHVPANVQDAQTLYFRLKVTTQEPPGNQVYDTFILRFLDAVGNPITDEDIPIRDNTTPTDWVNIFVDLNGMTNFADQDIQIQFECITNSTNDTSFVLDLVSLNLVCEAATPTPTQTPTQTETPSPVYYVYLPVVIRDPTPPPTETPTSTPTPTKTPCPSHTPCPSDCVYHCPNDCPSDCPSDCGYVCIYDCPLDCIYYCGYDYCSYDCPYDW